jgi:glycosyltransferase involved in cell wall biosynthesis
MPVDVTAVVPTHNRRELLGRTLQSIRAQRGVDVEIVVVDDGSNDGTAAAVNALADPRVRVLRNDVAQGVANARNRGLEAVSTPWVAFCDDDDLWAPTKLQEQLGAIARVPGAQWSSSGAVTVDDELRFNGPAVHPPPDGDVANDLLVRNAVPGGASSVLVATALVREVGGFDPSLSVSADFDMWTRLALASPHAQADLPLVAYMVRATSMAHDSDRHVRDLRIVEQRYAIERDRRDVAFGWRSYLRYIGAGQLRAGRRIAAARTHLTLARRHGDREARALLWRGLLAPRRVQRSRDARLAAELPAGWRDTAEQWIAPLRPRVSRAVR